MELNFATNTTLSLLNQLGRSTDDDAFDVDGTFNGATDSYSASGQSVDNYHTFMIRDSLQTGGYMYGAVSFYSDDLDELSSHLTSLRDKEIEILASNPGTTSHTQLLNEKQSLELDLSAFIGARVHSDSIEFTMVQGNTDDQPSFMDVINIRANSSDPNSEVVGMISSIEVEMSEIFQNSHDPSNCAHCREIASGGNGFESPVALATSSTSGATADKGFTFTGSSSDSQVETIRKGVKWNVGASDTLSYSFYEGTVPYPTTYNDGDTDSGGNGQEAEVSAAGPDNATHLSQVMAAWDKAVDFDFNLVTEDANTGQVGDIRMAFTNVGTSGGRAAFAYYPSSSHVGGDVWFETADIESNFDSSGNDFNSTGLGDGGYSWYAALHEVGHALGLSHPFDGGSSTGVMLPDNEDNMRTSVMSYTQLDRNLVFQYQAAGGGSWDTGNSYRVYATTPMLADVKAMDHIYGGETTSDGDDNYTFNNHLTRLQPLMMQTIIDSGGTDTIDLSNQTRNSTLNLTGGTLSSIGIWSEADQIAHWATQTGLSTLQVTNSFTSYNNQATASGKSTGAIYTGADNLGIAHNANIENAIGGQGDDNITGNSLDNMITGGNGNDTIDGGDGNDVAVFSGDRSSYTINTNGGTTTVASGGSEGTDTLTNIEFLKFTASNASARGASLRTSLTAVTDLSSENSTFNISVDGGNSVSVTLTARDYSGLSMNDLMTDLQTAINNALTADGQSSSVTVSTNSPLQITSNETGASSAIAISSLSGPLQAALGTIETEQRIEFGDTVYYAVGGGYITTTPTGDFTPSNPTPPTPPSLTPLTPPTPSSPSSPGSPGNSAAPKVIPRNAAGLPSHIGSISVETQEDAAKAVIVLDRAIEQITQSQAKLGAIQNRLDYNISNLSKSAMQAETAKGRITDADFAAETAILVKNQILQQAAMQALNMANQSRQGVLGLIG